MEFDIEFPLPRIWRSLSPDQCRALKYQTVMHDVNIEEMRRMKHQRRQEAYDKDEESTVKEDAGPRPRVRCAQHSS